MDLHGHQGIMNTLTCTSRRPMSRNLMGIAQTSNSPFIIWIRRNSPTPVAAIILRKPLGCTCLPTPPYPTSHPPHLYPSRLPRHLSMVPISPWSDIIGIVRSLIELAKNRQLNRKACFFLFPDRHPSIFLPYFYLLSAESSPQPIYAIPGLLVL